MVDPPKTRDPRETRESHREVPRENARENHKDHPSKEAESRTQRHGAPTAGLPANLPPFMPVLISLVGQIRQELEFNIPKLLSLNPGRREAIAHYLDRLAGLPEGPSTATGVADAAGGLRRWVDGLKSPQQHGALRMFFEEVALITLGQAILLKTWSDRGLRPLKEDDLGRLNWALSCALKPHLPLDREGWQITRPNLYSWYNPSPQIQRDMWNALEGWSLRDENPSFLVGLLRLARQYQPNWPEIKGYDLRFYTSIWEHTPQFGVDLQEDKSPLRRKKMVFSPTLRDAPMVRTGPNHLNWIALECHAFQLFVAELVQLWWGPSVPPLWAPGTGLEVHTRDQLSLALSSPKPSLYARIAEMEACDLAMVLEERSIRSSGRNPEACSFRDQVAQFPYFKNIKSNGTSLGDLQACIALTKLRPSGLMWWFREEPLSASDGSELLNFLLDRAKLLCEWDLSEVSHSLPTAAPLFPKYMYLFQRETNLQSRHAHRPARISLHGQMRSHIEVPIILDDALSSFSRASHQARGNWQIHIHHSPTPQKDWAERWPDPTMPETIRSLEELRVNSSPLASISTVRITPQGDPSRDHAWSVHASLKGFWIRADHGDEGRKLVVSSLPNPIRPAKGSGFLILVTDEGMISPLMQYLSSPPVQQWLDHHAERRGERWHLTEQIVKFIPIPRPLIQALGIAIPGMLEHESTAPAPLSLPTEWEALVMEVLYRPRAVLDRLADLPNNELGKTIRAQVFVKASRSLDQLKTEQGRLFSLVTSDGSIRWKDLLEILPKSEITGVSYSEHVQLLGSLPLHLPISKIERVRTPTQGVLLATESGFHLHIGSNHARIIDMIWDQVQGLVHPTWNELAQYLRLPRRLELAEATASDILKSHGAQSMRLKELGELLSACIAF